MQAPAIDLTYYQFRRELGDLMLFGTWVTVDGDLGDTEPCLVIVPRHRLPGAHDRTKPACVALSSAYKYDDPKYLLYAARTFNEALGFEDSMSRVKKLADLIHDHLQDLIELPPRPRKGSQTGAIITVTDHSSGRSRELEAKDDL